MCVANDNIDVFDVRAPNVFPLNLPPMEKAVSFPRPTTDIDLDPQTPQKETKRPYPHCDASNVESLREQSSDPSELDNSVFTCLTNNSLSIVSNSSPPACNHCGGSARDASHNSSDPRPDTNKISLILTNARSLAPKFASLIDLYKEIDTTFGIITESWLCDGEILEKDLLDLEKGTSLKMIYKNRTSKRKRTSRYITKRGGGVAIVYNMNRISLSEHQIKSNTYELVAATGKLSGTNRHICVMAIYVPPKMKAKEFEDLNECIIAAINAFKVKYTNPVIILGGI